MNTTKHPIHHRPPQPSRRRGFTLVELLLVLTILAILAGIVLPKFSGVSQKAQNTAAKTDISNFKTALSMFEMDMGYFPPAANGLQALVVKPSGAGSKWRKYLDVDKIPNDPWNNPYVYENPGKHNPDTYDVYSLGPDGKGGKDAIGNWTSDEPEVSPRHARAFTLVELVIVMTLMVIAISVAAPPSRSLPEGAQSGRRGPPVPVFDPLRPQPRRLRRLAGGFVDQHQAKQIRHGRQPRLYRNQDQRVEFYSGQRRANDGFQGARHAHHPVQLLDSPSPRRGGLPVLRFQPDGFISDTSPQYHQVPAGRGSRNLDRGEFQSHEI
jgi:general secretion pathway protein G